MQMVKAGRLLATAHKATCALLVTALSWQSTAAWAQTAPAGTPPPDAATEGATERIVPAEGEVAPPDAVTPAEEETGVLPPATEAPPPEVVAPEVVAPTEGVPPPAEVEPEPRSPTAAYVLWGLGGAGLVLGTVYGVMALKSKKDFDDAPSVKLADEAKDRAIISDVGLGLGLILGITGTVFYFARSDDGERSARGPAKRQHAFNDVRVAPFVSGRASGGSLSLRF